MKMVNVHLWLALFIIACRHVFFFTLVAVLVKYLDCILVF